MPLRKGSAWINLQSWCTVLDVCELSLLLSTDANRYFCARSRKDFKTKNRLTSPLVYSVWLGVYKISSLMKPHISWGNSGLLDGTMEINLILTLTHTNRGALEFSDSGQAEWSALVYNIILWTEISKSQIPDQLRTGFWPARHPWRV